MHTFTVELRYSAEFPMDMLRYDSATAATVDDQALINIMANPHTDRSQLNKTVHITLTSSDRHAPHTLRWESFGVRVIETDNPYGEISRPAAPRMTRLDSLSIRKRDADAYDIDYTAGVYDRVKSGRVARLRAAFTEDEKGVRTATPGTWRILWEGDRLGLDLSDDLTSRDFASAHEAFAVFVEKVLN
ncbi:hypothetical protein MARCHEWKA_03800 [Brevundimonas phage vB_BpoS-Marchewka]|uniref:Uncharacterized protein n=1 Tax=Brevundimonas phage vB_BpoS-Marchewka TaxID=2948604 RepID=A0A9E7N5F8_9CAUD|nr:hypothetical protein MARCHEWKA_03800 [Brevundimonas phage vB_BpoS-Marchewka]UTC29338.1 hypothetical protein BAMBUS_02560 [Brevundimonas phage vB_BpoS-Bambus]